MIQYTPSEEPAKKKPKAISTRSNYAKTRQPLSQGRKACYGPQVQTEVAGSMKSRASAMPQMPSSPVACLNDLRLGERAWGVQAKAAKPKK